MKKLFLLFLMSVVCMFANAEEITSDDYSLYLEDATVQVGTSVDVYVKIKYSNQVGAAQFKLDLPAGITVESFKGYNGTSATEAGDADSYYVLGGCQGLETVGVFTLSVSSDINVDVYTITITDFKMADYNAPAIKYVGENVESTLTVQKAAVIEPQDPNYAFEIDPFVIKAGETKNIPLNLKSNGSDVCYFSCKVTYPSGITNAYTSGRGGAKVMTKATIDNKNLYTEVSPDEAAEWGVSPMTFSQTIAADGSSAVYTVNSETNATYDTFVDTEDYETIINIPVMADNNLTDGIYTLKISDISITTFDGANPSTEYVGGEYLASVIVGQPAAQEVILYGNYNEATASAFTTALKNVAIADVTAATVADGVKFTDVIVNEKGGNSYYTRTSAYYGTTVLPFDLTSDESVKFYKVKEMSASSIVIEEVDFDVPANTPCIFKGTINVEGPTRALGDPSEQTAGTATFKGTYQYMYLGAGEGYYISSDGYFYNDGASVRPFRAYFEGAVNDAKLRILLQDETGVKDITNELSDEAIYTLQGIRVNNAQKGINIKGGKKIYVK